MSGIAPRMADAIVSAYRIPNAPWTVAKPTGIVMMSGLLSTSSGHSRSFYDVTNAKMATAATAGRASGMMIRA